jgi:hypothetical protein
MMQIFSDSAMESVESEEDIWPAWVPRLPPEVMVNIFDTHKGRAPQEIATSHSLT